MMVGGQAAGMRVPRARAVSPDVWTIALAAGAGRRLASVTAGTPKQFWSPRGDRSLLEETLARMCPVTTPGRLVTVVDDTHGTYVARLSGGDLVHVIYQPRDRGTAAGVLLPLLYVWRTAPEAIVILTPSDHSVTDPAPMLDGVSQAIRRVARRRTDVVLFGVEPTSPAVDYGWLTTEGTRRTACGRFQRLMHFTEKPPRQRAEELFASGGIWNTMVLVARASALLERFRRSLPDLTDALLPVAGRGRQPGDPALQNLYDRLQVADFCRDLLTVTRPLSMYAWPASIGWSDLGTPERLHAWLGEDEPQPVDRATGAAHAWA